jgi:diguanylate cyclase (GGDEF)-like protein
VDDYIADAGRGRELRARVEGQLRHLRNREIQQWASTQRTSLRTMAHTDALTGVANRRGISRALERLLASGEALTLIFVDLDHFKRINDTYGHAAGDLVLRHAARALWSAASPGDIAGRWGGEEFAIVLRASREVGAEAFELGERFRRSVADISVCEVDESLRVTASVGVTGWNGAGEAPTAADLFRAADDALYRAKREGRNRVHTSRVPCA